MKIHKRLLLKGMKVTKSSASEINDAFPCKKNKKI